MRRHRRFPIVSTLVALGLGAAVVMVSLADATIPQMALDKVRTTVSSMGQSLVLLASASGDGGLFVFDDPADNPSNWAENNLPMLVNNDTPVPDGFAPKDLVLMRDYCDENIVYIKGSEIEGEREAVDALMVMFEAAISQGVSNWQISAGYRSVKYQQTVWDNKVYEYRQQGLSGSQAQEATAKYVAKPGGSEHHTGLAFDVTVPGESFPLTDQSKWLAANCWDYGFIIRYAEDKVDITGINAEPWHVRYVGKAHSTVIRDNNWALEEYIAYMTKDNGAQ